MSDPILVIGDKRYSSWSLRPWLALKVGGIKFREEMVRLRQPDTKANILKQSSAGHVPILKHDGLTIWESLAICEYIADRYPAAGLWPDDPAARAIARSTATEMHGGFQPLRQNLSMDTALNVSDAIIPPEAQADIDRITALWRNSRATYGKGGAMLFGRFSIADCMYAPVVSRFVTFNVKLDPVSAAYRDAVMALLAMQEWYEAGRAEAAASA